MRKYLIIPMLFLLAITFTSCEKDPEIVGLDQQDDLFKEGSTKYRHGQVFTVTPNGINDTQNILDAFESAKAAGTGNTVELIEGTYYLDILIVPDFDGYFVGAGKGTTKIVALPNQDCQSMQDNTLVPALITFNAGFPRISDLTIELNEAPCEPWINPLYPTYINVYYLVTLSIVPNPIDPNFDCNSEYEVEEGHSEIDNIEFKDNGPTISSINHISMGYIINYFNQSCIGWFKTLSGNHSVTNCDFYGAVTGVSPVTLIDSNVVIGGSTTDGNTFSTNYFGIESSDNGNTIIDISHNKINTRNGIWLYGGQTPLYFGIPYYPTSDYHIYQNEIMSNNLGVTVQDDGMISANKTLNVMIEKNKLLLDDGAAGIYGRRGHGTMVLSNKFSGTSLFGVFLGYDGPTSSNWMLKGNNFNNLNASWGPILLGPDSESCTVVGGNNMFNVYDEGANNILTGVNNQGNPPGPAIKEAMMNRQDIFRRRRR